MKVRNGFVSNSSSSSFVCLGIDISDNKKLMKTLVNEEDELSEDGVKLLPEHSSYLNISGGNIVGWFLGKGSSDDGSFYFKDVGLDQLGKYADEFEKATGVKPRLMGGTYLS